MIARKLHLPVASKIPHHSVIHKPVAIQCPGPAGDPQHHHQNLPQTPVRLDEQVLARARGYPAEEVLEVTVDGDLPGGGLGPHQGDEYIRPGCSGGLRFSVYDTDTVVTFTICVKLGARNGLKHS